MSVYFISDLHLGGQYAFRFYGRPFKSYRHFEETIIANMHSCVSRNDDIYFIGDYIDYDKLTERSGTWEHAMSLTQSLPGRKHLVLGNNEERLIGDRFQGFEDFKEYALSCGFIDCTKSSVVKVKGNIFYLDHYLEHARTDMLNLYGHVHRGRSVSIRGFNVSCDLTGYYPLSDMQLIAILDRELTYSLRQGHIPDGKYLDRELWDKYRNTWMKYINQL